MTHLPAIGAGLLLLLSGAALAQTGISRFEPLVHHPTEWATDAPPGAPFVGLGVGRFTDTVDADVVHLRAGELQLHVRPVRFTEVTLIEEGVEQFVIVPGGGGAGLDSLVTITSSGAGDLWVPTQPPGATPLTKLVGVSLNWSGSGPLRNAANGTFFALSASADRLHRLQVGPTSLLTLPDLVIPAAALDVAPVRWNGVDALATLYADRVEVFQIATLLEPPSTATPEPLHVEPLAGSEIRLVVAPSATPSEQDLVVVTSFWSGIGSVLVVFDSDHADVPLYLGPDVVGGLYVHQRLTGVPVSRHDVVLCDQNQNDVWFLEHRDHALYPDHRLWLFPGLEANGPGTAFHVPSQPTPTMAAAFAGGDIDGDGDNDTVLGFHASGEVHIYLEMTSEDRVWLAPTLHFGAIAYDPATCIADMNITLNALSSYGGRATHLELAVYHQSDVDNHDLEDDSWTYVSTEPVKSWLLEPRLLDVKNQTLQIPLVDEVTEESALHFHLRGVEIDGGAVTWRGPLLVYIKPLFAEAESLVAELPEVLDFKTPRDPAATDSLGAVNTTGGSGATSSRPTSPPADPPPGGGGGGGGSGG